VALQVQLLFHVHCGDVYYDDDDAAAAADDDDNIINDDNDDDDDDCDPHMHMPYVIIPMLMLML
tara:strand:+ start:206 stop:397 length:192 start_codon:yes stop_codon:yes gene_type:complete